MLRAWMHNSGLDVPEIDFDSKNVALVNVSGRISAHAGKGQKIPLTVSTVGDSKSLKSGILLFTKLHFPGSTSQQQPIFATAEGPLMIEDGQTETVAKVQGIIYTPIPSTIIRDGQLKLLLNNPNYVDADRVSRQINQHFARLTGHNNTAKPLTAGLIQVEVPEQMTTQPISFIAQMKKVPILFTDVAPKIIINTRNNMVMLNEKVEVSPFAFAFKDLNVVVGDAARRAPNIDSQFVQSVNPTDADKTDLQNLVDALNAMRVNPRDLVEVIKYAHKIGAIQAELILE
jgi:flagellar P-ring protein precursor FlgI